MLAQGQTLQDIVQTQIAISLIDLAAGLIIATGLGVFLVFAYRFTHRALHYERSFLTTLLLMPPIVALVMMLIGSNLALSLGMVGALSIIRFRTVIKDSRDMVYLFLAIAIGLGCGTYNWVVCVIATTFLLAMVVALHYLGFGRRMHSDHVLVISGEGEPPSEEIKETIMRHLDYMELRSLDVKKNSWEMVFEVRFANGRPLPAELSLELQRVHGAGTVSLLAPQLSLPL